MNTGNKWILGSKTFWLGAATLAAAILNLLLQEEWFQAYPTAVSVVGFVIGALTIVVRYFTGQGVTLAPPPQTKFNGRTPLTIFAFAILLSGYAIFDSNGQGVFQKARARWQANRAVPASCVGGNCISPQVVYSTPIPPPVFVQSAPSPVVYSTQSYPQASSVLPSVVPASAQPDTSHVIPPRTQADFSPIEMGSDKFWRTQVKAIAAARRAGKISAADALKLRTALFSPAFRDQCKQLCVTQMVFSGESDEFIPRTETGAVDVAKINWEGLAEFLERMVPLILQILQAFGIG